MDEHLIGWVALCLVPRIGGRTLSALLAAFGSPRAIFDASPSALQNVPLVGPGTVAAIREIDLKAVERQIIDWRNAGVSLITWQDSRYPTPFMSLSDRPPLLFARGQLDQDWSKVAAIVGTREPDVESVKIAETLGRELAQRGWVIVSGLARGIDVAGHRGALESGQTIGILGSGVNNVQPMSSRSIARRLLEKGAIYSEVPPDSLPSVGSLMARNRLISGLAKAVIVVQAGIHSGSMEAARRARQQQRAVIALDYPDYEGNQALLRMDAIPLSPDFGLWDNLSVILENLPDPPRQLSLF